MEYNSAMEPNHLESLFPPDGRYSEIEKVLSYIKSGNSAQILSLPGVGRSNILGLLSYNRQARELHLGEKEKLFHFVMMNFAEIKKRPLIDATKYLFLELAESLEERKKTEEYEYVKKLFDQSLTSNDEMVLFQGLKKTIDYLSLERELTVVFLFDRFEEYIPMLDPQFFSNLRVLRDRAKYHFSAVFPLNHPLEELVGPEMLSDFYEFVVGNIVYLPLMDEKINNFRISYLEKTTGKKLEKQILEEIIKLTGGLGKLVRVSFEAYVSYPPIDKNLEEFLLKNSKIKAVLSEIWMSLTPFEQNLVEEGKAGESSNLVAIGLVKNAEIAIPLLETYIKTAKQEENQKIIYNSGTNEIKKGDLVISENLTSSEFKLLRFLVQNEGKILERDETVNAVWGNLSSTAGVSEQALDQLIFRVRKKTEENPNSPTHIQTIKGRGFKFTS